MKNQTRKQQRQKKSPEKHHQDERDDPPGHSVKQVVELTGRGCFHGSVML